MSHTILYISLDGFAPSNTTITQLDAVVETVYSVSATWERLSQRNFQYDALMIDCTELTQHMYRLIQDLRECFEGKLVLILPKLSSELVLSLMPDLVDYVCKRDGHQCVLSQITDRLNWRKYRSFKSLNGLLSPPNRFKKSSDSKSVFGFDMIYSLTEFYDGVSRSDAPPILHQKLFFNEKSLKVAFIVSDVERYKPYLKVFKSEVVVFTTYESARSSLQDSVFDMVFTTLHLPDFSGSDMIKGLATFIPPERLVVLDEFPVPEEIVNCYNLGVEEFYVLPLFKSTIESLLSRVTKRTHLVSNYFHPVN